MTVVSNTSPIINLAIVEQLPLLPQLYGRISIPCAVYRESAVKGAGQPGAQEIQRLDWMTSYSATDQALANSLSVKLDRGEAKHRGFTAAVKPLLDALITRAGFWVTNDLYARVLQAAGENRS